MARKQVAWNGVTRTATVQDYGAALPGGTTNAGDFYHDETEGDTDKQGDLIGHHGSHVMYHHVRDVLYKINVLDMANVTIVIA